MKQTIIEYETKGTLNLKLRRFKKTVDIVLRTDLTLDEMIKTLKRAYKILTK